MEKKICGFLLLMNNMNMNLIIDLICVDRNFHKKGIAKIESDWFLKNGIELEKGKSIERILKTQNKLL